MIINITWIFWIKENLILNWYMDNTALDILSIKCTLQTKKGQNQLRRRLPNENTKTIMWNQNNFENVMQVMRLIIIVIQKQNKLQDTWLFWKRFSFNHVIKVLKGEECLF